VSESQPSSRKPWLALVLSLFSTGLGHIYCGRIGTGLILFLASLLFAPLAVVAALLEPSTPLLVGLILAALGVLGLYLFAALDAYRTARRMGENFQPRDYNRGIVYALFLLVGVTYPAGVLHFLRANFFEAFAIPNASEAPNLLPGDRILVNKAASRAKFPRRGDLVVFHRPGDRRLTYVKRVIALPGDTVAVRAGRVFVNGKKLRRDPLPLSSLASIRDELDGRVFSESNAGSRYLILIGPAPSPVADYPPKKVPEDTCFVLGDNRNRSEDSRHFGFVPLGDIVGLVQYIYWPAETWSRFGAYRDDGVTG
jgi:signal peptidase I